MSSIVQAKLTRTVDITNGQLTPNNNTPLLTQALSGSSGASWSQPSAADQSAGAPAPQPHFSVSFAVMNNYQAAAAAAAQGFGPPASPHAASTRGGFPAANSPGPTIDLYNSSAGDSVGYVQAASPQPSSFPAIAVSRAPLNYNPGPLIPAAFTNGYH
ncbi:hypothetical protein HHI36_009190 [Cryptolaemus montrouzieri]|uniref:Uncharacterized protein n=1 Tax=Cryptolaemus montrouzieri TaxID=559131 RepID=A0ABD2MV56_9CUCU